MEKKKVEEAAVPQSDKKIELTKEQMHELITQLANENNQLKKQCQELYIAGTIKRLELMLTIVGSSYNFSAAFKKKCSKEIEELMFPKEDTNVEKKGH